MFMKRLHTSPKSGLGSVIAMSASGRTAPVEQHASSDESAKGEKRSLTGPGCVKTKKWLFYWAKLE